MKQLLCRDLKPGDILLRMTSEFSVSLRGDNPLRAVADTVLGRGRHRQPPAMRNKDCGYYVYRCTSAALARGAATCAKMFFDIASAGGGMQYAKIGAVKSVFGGGGNPKTAAETDALLDALLKGRNHNFFCSQFVVYVYQLAAYQSGLPAKTLFNISDAKVSPSVLASTLQGNSHFQEAGYMMPSER